jgi:hypothetical protein
MVAPAYCGQRQFRGVPKELLESLAKEVDVGPLKAGEKFGGSRMTTATKQRWKLTET